MDQDSYLIFKSSWINVLQLFILLEATNSISIRNEPTLENKSQHLSDRIQIIFLYLSGEVDGIK